MHSHVFHPLADVLRFVVAAAGHRTLMLVVTESTGVAGVVAERAGAVGGVATRAGDAGPGEVAAIVRSSRQQERQQERQQRQQMG